MLRLALLFAAICGALPAAADESPPSSSVLLSFGVGAGTAVAALALGGGLTTRSEQGAQDAGMQVLVSGLALAPILSHLCAREWKRAAGFGAVPVAAAIGMAIFLWRVPEVLSDVGEPDTRIPFGGLVILSVLSSTVGLVDSLLAGERAAPARSADRRWMVAPMMAGRGAPGLGVLGSW